MNRGGKAMLLNRKAFFIKEHVDFMRLAGTYDILDPESGQLIGQAKEEPGSIILFLRFLFGKKLLPNQLNVYDILDQRIAFYIKKPASFLRAKVLVYDGDGTCIGYFISKLITLVGGFYVYDIDDRQVAEITGDWKGWNFRFVDQHGQDIGRVTKKWAGIGRELFTSADNYMISIDHPDAQGPRGSMLLLAAGLAIDTIFKEKKD